MKGSTLADIHASVSGDEATAVAMATASVGFQQAATIAFILQIALFWVWFLAFGPVALRIDARDFACDAATYVISLVAVWASPMSRAKAALSKGILFGILGAYLLGTVLWRTFVAGTPILIGMGWSVALALAVNVAAALLLRRFRGSEANMRSAWLYARNDAIRSFAVVVAALVVERTHTRWADLAVAGTTASLFLSSAWQIIWQVHRELQAARA